jgi:hypothetical protein
LINGYELTESGVEAWVDLARSNRCGMAVEPDMVAGSRPQSCLRGWRRSKRCAFAGELRPLLSSLRAGCETAGGGACADGVRAYRSIFRSRYRKPGVGRYSGCDGAAGATPIVANDFDYAYRADQPQCSISDSGSVYRRSHQIRHCGCAGLSQPAVVARLSRDVGVRRNRRPLRTRLRSDGSRILDENMAWSSGSSRGIYQAAVLPVLHPSLPSPLSNTRLRVTTCDRERHNSELIEAMVKSTTAKLCQPRPAAC